MSNQDQDNARHALDAGIDAARLVKPLIEFDDGRKFAFVPEGYRLNDITDKHLLFGEIEQQVTFDDRDSLTNYTNRFQDDRSIIIADYDDGKITCHLDWHSNNEHELKRQLSRHNACLDLRDSEEYKRWNGMQDIMHPQAEFAVFIEENVVDITNPDHSQMLEICRDLEASTDSKFSSGTRLDSGDRAFRYETETKIKGEVKVPTKITLSIPLYQGEAPTEIEANFRFKATPTGLLLGFVWHRVEHKRQATFRELATQVCEDTGVPVLYGRK